MAGQNYNSSESNDMFVIVAFIALFAAFQLLKANFEYIAFVWKWIRVGELGLFYWIPDWFPIYGKLEIKEAFHFLLNKDYDLIHPDTVAAIDRRYSGWFAWIPGLLCIYLGTKLTGRSMDPMASYNMETLLLRMQNLYSHVPQYVGEDPVDKDIELNRDKIETYRWSMALRPNDFALLQPPLGLEEKALEDTTLNSAIWDGAQGFDLDLAERTFVNQLGESFTGIESFNEVEHKLYDYLVKEIAIDPKLAEEKVRRYSLVILEHKDKDNKFKIKNLSQSENNLYKTLEAHIALLQKKQKNKFDIDVFLHYKNIDRLLKNPHFADNLKNLCAERAMAMHAFKRTAFMALLSEVRKGGVVPTLKVQWVKGVDRVLYFCLSSVGRKVSFSECSGCFAHFIIEEQIGRPLNKPEVHEAVTGLHKALNLSED